MRKRLIKQDTAKHGSKDYFRYIHTNGLEVLLRPYYFGSRSALYALPLQQPQLSGIPAFALQILPESQILVGDGVLANTRQAEDGQRGAEYAQGARDIEGVLRRGYVVATRSLDIREDVGADEGTDLAKGCSDGVVLTANASRRGLRRDQTDVVTCTDFAEGQKDAKDDGESSDVLGLGQLFVETRHDKSDDSLGEHTPCKSPAWANPIGEKGTTHGAWDIEQINDRVPSK